MLDETTWDLLAWQDFYYTVSKSWICSLVSEYTVELDNR